MRTLFPVPFVSVIKRFDCTSFELLAMYLYDVPSNNKNDDDDDDEFLYDVLKCDHSNKS